MSADAPTLGWSAGGALLGMVVALGLLLVSRGIHAAGPPRLTDRVAVHLGGRRSLDPSPVGPLTTLLRLFSPSLEALAARLGHGGRAALELRLDRAGSAADVDRFRLEQLGWGAVGLAMGLTSALVLAGRAGSLSVAPLLVICALGAFTGLLARDWELSRATRRRAERIAEQFPTVAELIAFAVAAGESPVAALDRVSHTVTGDLAQELARCVGDVRAGAPFPMALRQFADRLQITPVSRFVDGVITAVDRGTPLADVVRAQAADARSAARRALLESAARKEVAMLVPVVFLVLPTIVVIALFPGLASLTLSAV